MEFIKVNINNLNYKIKFNDEINYFLNNDLSNFIYENYKEYSKDTVYQYINSLNIPCKNIILTCITYLMYNLNKKEFLYILNNLLDKKIFTDDKFKFLFAFFTDYRVLDINNKKFVEEKIANTIYLILDKSFQFNIKYDKNNISVINYFNNITTTINCETIFSKKLFFQYIFKYFYYWKKLNKSEKEDIINTLSYHSDFFINEEAFNFFVKYFKNKAMLKIFQQKY